MAPTWIETDTNTNVNISSATAVGVYTSTGDKFVMPQVLADQVAGNGDYVYYVTLQVNGAGTHYVLGPKTTQPAAAGETGIGAQGGFIAVRAGDVVTVYVDGLAGDTATPDVTVRWFELDASANVTMWKDAIAPAMTGDAYARLGAPAGASVSADIASIDGNVDLLLAVDTSTTDATTAGVISRRRGNSWSIPLTIGAITGYTSLWFTVKSSYDDADTSALVQVKLNSPSALDGLLYVNGTTASSAALGSITVSDATTGAIVVNLDETITDDLAPGTYYYDVQTLISGNVATPDSGTFTVTADVTRSVA